MQLVIDRQGVVHTLYDESLDLSSLGRAVLTRASHIEPDADGQWWRTWCTTWPPWKRSSPPWAGI